MRRYHAYLLRIDADVPLPAPPGKGGEPDLCIRRRPLAIREVDGSYVMDVDGPTPERLIGNGGDRIVGGIYDELLFVVREGDTILYHVRKPLPEGALQSYLFGVLMSTLLRQRGMLVLHACSVARDGNAVAFVGESGWGKSTLAEYFCQRGYTLLSDDVLAIDASGDARPQVIPGYPQIRLRTEAGRHLRPDFDDLPRVNAKQAKRFTTPTAFPEAPVPLRQVYLLDPTYAEATRREPVEKRGALLRLVHHTRATNLVKAPAFQSQLFQQCEQVVRHVPVHRLHRARDLDRLDEIYTLVDRDLEGADAPPARAAH